MSYSHFLPSNRAVLFANLGQALSNGDKFPQIFVNVADISPDCYRQSLEDLAQAVREEPDKPLLEHIKQAHLFLDWEVRFIQFGLATLKITEVFARLCEYYVLIGKASSRLYWWLAGLWIMVSFTAGYLAWHFGPPQSAVYFGLGCSGAALLAGWQCGGGVMRSWVSPDSLFWGAAARIPQFRSLVVARSVYQYLLNLGLCIQGGMDLSRSLKVCARSEPIGWLRQRYQGVAADVAGGSQISKAFIASGILTETRITATPRDEQGKPHKLWEPGITDVIRDSYTQQLEFAARTMPFLLLVPLAVVWTCLALA